MDANELKLYGPLAGLIGSWEGVKGSDRAPNSKRNVETNLFKEKMVFEPMGMVNNHEQTLYSLRYRTMAWKKNAQGAFEDNPFHEELGYWLWDAKEKQVMRCFMVPRGVTVIAGGTAEAGAKEFKLEAKVGSDTYGICSNLFLDREFKTVKYLLTVKTNSDGTISYEEDTQLQIKGQNEIFHHTDSNTLKKI